MRKIDEIKLKYLINELKQREILVPSRADIQEILSIGYIQSGAYMKEVKKCRP